MLATLDQWAFQFLMMLWTLLGVQELPQVQDPSWTVIERWSEQPDKTYKLVIESKSISNICMENHNSSVVFPQVYFARQSVYLDNILISTSDPKGNWHLGSANAELIIPCLIVSQGQSLMYKVESRFKFYASIWSYPYITKVGTISHFFNTTLYVIAFAIATAIGCFGAILMFSMAPKLEVLNFFLQDLILAILMFSYYPEMFGYFDTNFIHSLVPFCLFATVLFLVKPFLLRNYNIIFYTIILIMGVICWASIGYRDLTLFLCTIVTVPAVLLFLIANYKIYFGKLKYSFLEKILYIFVLIFSIKDTYVSLISRSGYFHLTIITLACVIINFVKLIRSLQSMKLETIIAENKLNMERKISQNISEVNALQKEIIHDLKSPLTALNFSLRAEVHNKENIGFILIKIMKILKRMEDKQTLRANDWYSISKLEEIILTIIGEKKLIKYFDFKLVNRSEVQREMYFDPDQLDICLSELIDNSLKYNSNLSKLEINLSYEDGFVCIELLDIGAVIDLSVEDYLGEKGISTEGSGFGLYGVRNKMEAVGGEFKINQTSLGVSNKMYLKSRDIF